MSLMSYCWLLIILAVGATSDVLLKMAASSGDKLPLYMISLWLVWGVSIYPWVAAVRDNGIITFTVMFTITHTLVSVCTGLYYDEPMTMLKGTGIVLAIISAILVIKG